MSYDELAHYYDALMGHVDYTPWLAQLEPWIRPGDLVLDAACGTGAMSLLLTQRGYSVIAADASPAMLTEARQKTSEPLFLCQRLEELDLYGTVKAAVCCLDSLNYITKPESFIRAIERVLLFLEPGGVFLFDVKAPEALAAAHKQRYILQTDEVFCVWETRCRKTLCTHDITLFAREGHLWRRYDERHTQRAYPSDWITAALQNAGFASVKARKDILQDQGRIFFLCRK